MNWQYVVIIVLVLALAGVCVWAVGLRRRLSSSAGYPAPPPVVVTPLPAAPSVPAPPPPPPAARAKEPAPEVPAPSSRPARPASLTAAATPGALPDTPHPVPDSTVDGARLGRLVVRSAAARGERGRLDARVRRHEVWTSVLPKFEPPVLLSCVAGGVATSDHSYLGAAQACRSLQGRLAERATSVAIDAAWKDGGVRDDGIVTAELQRLLRSTAAGVGNSLKLAADERTLQPEELSTSLIFLLTRLGDGPRRQHLVAGVGDGVLLRLGASGKWSHEAPEAEASLAVIPANADQVSVRQLATGPGDVLVLCSGTTAPFLRQDGAAVKSDWQSGPPDLVRFLWHLNVSDPIEREDRAAVALWESLAPAEARPR